MQLNVQLTGSPATHILAADDPYAAATAAAGGVQARQAKGLWSPPNRSRPRRSLRHTGRCVQNSVSSSSRPVAAAAAAAPQARAAAYHVLRPCAGAVAVH